ncbi:MAG: hypothetical protein RBR50_01050 [Candidatus Izemoplasmatales bacterium]|jgi:hypothetical protein|nr:hypothetical protein [Candidatus Izemoplasmatales bacterium]
MNDFKSLVDGRVQIVATVHSYHKESFSNVDRALLQDVFVNGQYFRDHVWVRKSKRFKDIGSGTVINAFCTLVEYRGENEKKLGLRHLRGVKVINTML